MSGWDIFVSRVLTKREIRMALAVILGIKQGNIVIVKSISEREDVNDATEILCQTFLCGDEHFPLRIDIYVHKQQIAASNLSIFKKLSDIVRADVLVSDETPDPVSFWLIHYGNGTERTIVSDSILDEQNMKEIDLKD